VNGKPYAPRVLSLEGKELIAALACDATGWEAETRNALLNGGANPPMKRGQAKDLIRAPNNQAILLCLGKDVI